jgi:hypothetical protein
MTFSRSLPVPWCCRPPSSIYVRLCKRNMEQNCVHTKLAVQYKLQYLVCSAVACLFHGHCATSCAQARTRGCVGSPSGSTSLLDAVGSLSLTLLSRCPCPDASGSPTISAENAAIPSSDSCNPHYLRHTASPAESDLKTQFCVKNVVMIKNK